MAGGAGSSLRCFIGAFIVPEDAELLRTAAASGAVASPDARDVPLTNYHVTVKFLGDLQPLQMAYALEETAALAGRPVTVGVPAFAGFPDTDAARLLAGLVEDPGPLSLWRDRLDAAFGSDGRPFLPHVTLQRWRRPRRVDRWILDPPLDIRLRAPDLYCSDRERDGAHYRPVTEADITRHCG